VPVAFYEAQVVPTFAKNPAIVYVLPEVKTVQEVFGSYDVSPRDADTRRLRRGESHHLVWGKFGSHIPLPTFLSGTALLGCVHMFSCFLRQSRAAYLRNAAFVR